MARWRATTLALIAAFTLGACATASETDTAADLAAVDTLREAFVSAYKAGDAEAFANLYTPDAISQPNHQQTVSGRDAIVEHQREMFSQFTVEIALMPEETKTMRDFGFDRGRYTLTLTPKAGGTAITDVGRYTVLLQKGADGAWRVARDIDNSTMTMPGPPPVPSGETGATPR